MDQKRWFKHVLYIRVIQINNLLEELYHVEVEGVHEGGQMMS